MAYQHCKKQLRLGREMRMEIVADRSENNAQFSAASRQFLKRNPEKRNTISHFLIFFIIYKFIFCKFFTFLDWRCLSKTTALVNLSPFFDHLIVAFLFPHPIWITLSKMQNTFATWPRPMTK